MWRLFFKKFTIDEFKDDMAEACYIPKKQLSVAEKKINSMPCWLLLTK